MRKAHNKNSIAEAKFNQVIAKRQLVSWSNYSPCYL